MPTKKKKYIQLADGQIFEVIKSTDGTKLVRDGIAFDATNPPIIVNWKREFINAIRLLPSNSIKDTTRKRLINRLQRSLHVNGIDDWESQLISQLSDRGLTLLFSALPGDSEFSYLRNVLGRKITNRNRLNIFKKHEKAMAAARIRRERKERLERRQAERELEVATVLQAETNEAAAAGYGKGLLELIQAKDEDLATLEGD
jgi:hypothetical protein